MADLYPNAIMAGFGNDLLEGRGGADTLDGGAGSDTAVYSTSPSGVTVDLSDSASELGGDAEGDTLISIEKLIGSAFDDTLTGSNIANNIQGGTGNDTIRGGSANDTLLGQDGADTMFGDDGNDTLTGGAGKDVMTGGAGNDTFVFVAVTDSPADSRTDLTLDRIEDFVQGQDKIDLAGIDANTGADGDQAFAFITGAFTNVPGQLHVVASRTAGIDRVEMDNDGDGTADLSVLVNHQTTWSASDFVL